MYSRRHLQEQGFTVPELITAITIATVLMVGVISILVNLAGSGAAVIRTTEQIRTNQDTISDIQTDMPLTTRFLATPTLADASSSESPLGANGWKIHGTNANSRILILQTYATTHAVQSPDRKIVYFDDSLGGCPVGRTPVTNNVIYFVKNNTLYRRLLREPASAPSAPYCTGQTIAQQQTCTTPGSPANPNCTAKDVVVATNIQRFSVQYFAEPTSASPIANAHSTDPLVANAAIANASTIRIDVESTTSNPDDTPLLSSYRKMIKGNSRAL